MCLAESDTAMHEERVISFGRRLGDSQRRRVRKIVVWADDERVERVAGIEMQIQCSSSERLFFGMPHLGDLPAVLDPMSDGNLHLHKPFCRLSDRFADEW